MRYLHPANALCLLTAVATLSACGGHTVGGHTLSVEETAYGSTAASGGLYCEVLDPRGQYEVVLTDFALCSSADNPTVFHSTEETNLRLVFSSAPDVITKYPSQVTLKVGTTHGCTDNNLGVEAAAFFAHNGTGPAYDFVAEADSGTITVNYFVPPSNATGSFDLHFGEDHVSGTFDAPYCQNLTPKLVQ